MKGHNSLLRRGWILPIIVVAIPAVHGILPYVLWHKGVSVGLVSGVTTLVVIKHLGLLGSLSALLQRWRRARHLEHGSTSREQNLVDEGDEVKSSDTS